MFFDKYYLLEYIQSSGTQYINTGYIDTQNTGYELKFLATSASNNDGFIGSLSGSVGHAIRYYSSKWTVRWASINNEYGSFSTNTLYTLQANYNNSKNVVANGTTIYSNLPNANTNIPSFIFAQNNASSAQYISKLRVYSCKITDGQTLVRNFVPAQRKSDNVIGLYDLVNDVFYTNAGSGTFTAGHIIDVLANPIGSASASVELAGNKVIITSIPNIGWKFLNWQLNDYTQLEYIESSGTQYIETNVADGGELEMSERVKFLTTSPTNQIFGFGGNGGMGLGTAGSSWWELSSLNPVSTNFDYILEYKKNGTSVIRTVNGVSTSSTASYATAADTAKYFATWTSNTSSSMNYFCTQKFYWGKIKKDGVLIRDFIPVFKHSTGEIGLLDLCQLKFYGNSGTGIFKAGRKVVKYKTLEYLEGTGAQRIDTGFIPNNNTRFIIDIDAPDPTANTPSWAYGVRVAINNRSFGYLVRTGNDTSRADWGNSVVDFTKTLGRMEIDQNINKTYINGTLVATNTSTTFTCPYSLKILGCNLNGSIETYASPITLYFAKLYDNSILIRDYIPAQEIYEDGSLGKAGLYDKITKTMFISEDTGDLLVK